MKSIDIKKLLALVVIAGFFGILLLLFFVDIPKENMDLLKTFGVALMTSAATVFGYYFGSSAGSARKTELMTPPGQGEAGFIRLPLLAALMLICLVFLAGCATTSPTAAPTPQDSPQVLAGKSLLAAKTTIVVAATSVDKLCKAGTLPADKCAAARAAYELSKPAYDSAMTAYLLMATQGGDPASFAKALADLQGSTARILELTGGAK